METLGLLEAAERRLVSLVEILDEGDLARPTPCTGWDVRALLSHTLATIEAFAAAVDGESGPTEEELFSGADRIGDSAVDATQAAIARSRRAWASVTNWDAPISTALGPVPAADAVAIVTYSNLIHSWDLAVALGRRVEFDHAEAELARAVGERIVPSMRSQAFFGPEVHVAVGATPTERVLAFAGRTPL